MAYDESQHQRDEHGRFSAVGGFVNKHATHSHANIGPAKGVDKWVGKVSGRARDIDIPLVSKNNADYASTGNLPMNAKTMDIALRRSVSMVKPQTKKPQTKGPDAMVMTQAQIIKAFSALGCTCSPRSVEGASGVRYSVLVSMRNARTGTGWTDEVSEGEVDVAAVAKQIAARLKIQIRRADISSAVARATEES